MRDQKPKTLKLFTKPKNESLLLQGKTGNNKPLKIGNLFPLLTAWGEKMGEVSIAAAIVDRLLHHAHVIVLKGDSYRLKKRLANGLLPQANEFGVY